MKTLVIISLVLNVVVLISFYFLLKFFYEKVSSATNLMIKEVDLVRIFKSTLVEFISERRRYFLNMENRYRKMLKTEVKHYKDSQKEKNRKLSFRTIKK